MKKFPKKIDNTGVALFPRNNVDTDLIIPKNYLKGKEKTGLGRFLFDELRFKESTTIDDANKAGVNQKREIIDSCFLNKEEFKDAQVLITGYNFGCGSSREHACWSLYDYGFRVIIAESFGDIFYKSAPKNSLLLIKLSKEEIDSLSSYYEKSKDYTLSINLEKQFVSIGDLKISFEISEPIKEMLLEGLDDVSNIKKYSKEFQVYEQRKSLLPKIISVAPGDGIGPEVMDQTIKVLEKIGSLFGHEFLFPHVLVGGASIDEYGVPLHESQLKRIQDSDALLFGSIGGPKWDEIDPEIRPEKGLLALRKALGAYANLRPAAIFPQLIDASNFKPEVISGVDILVVRELTGGIYFGKRESRVVNGKREAYDTMYYNEDEIRRIMKVAFEAAMKRNKKLCSVEKANVLDVSKLWKTVTLEVAEDYPEVEVSHLYVDNAAMQLVINPKQFDVIVTGNLFGDILSDLSSVLGGSIGLLPSASTGGKVSMYEPIGGSAPDIAGQDKANPIAQILSAAMLLEYSFGLTKEAEAIRNAVSKTLDSYRTADISDEKCITIGCKEMGDKIVENITL
jgi:3-isopropylmalate dehydrogenase